MLPNLERVSLLVGEMIGTRGAHNNTHFADCYALLRFVTNGNLRFCFVSFVKVMLSAPYILYHSSIGAFLFPNNDQLYFFIASMVVLGASAYRASQ